MYLQGEGCSQLYESDETEVSQGKGQVGKKAFISYSLLRIASQAPIHLPPPTKSHHPLPHLPLPGEALWVGPW